MIKIVLDKDNRIMYNKNIKSVAMFVVEEQRNGINVFFVRDKLILGGAKVVISHTVYDETVWVKTNKNEKEK